MGDKAGPPPTYNPPPPAYPGQPGPPGQPGGYSGGGYPAQQYGMGYGGQQSSTVVVTGQPTVLIQQFREHSVRTQCPSCRADVLTSTHFETGTMTWVVAGVLCFVGLWLGCCLIPFCLDATKDVIHSCPQCRHMLGRYDRMR